MLHWLFGDIESVISRPRIDVVQRKGRGDNAASLHTATAEDAVTAWFRLQNGMTATLDTAFSAAANLPPHITLFGTDGLIEFGRGAELTLRRPGQDPETITVEGDGNPLPISLERWCAQICDAIQQKRQIGADFAAGVACARVMDRMRSAPMG